MGVTRGSRDFFDCGYIEDDDLILDVEEQEEPEVVIPVKRKSSHKNRSKGKQTKLFVPSDEFFFGKKKTGAKQTRRCENLRYLLSLVDDEEWNNLNMGIAEPSASVFAELLMDHEKFKIWTDFISKSEEQQQKILQNFNTPKRGREVGKAKAAQDDKWEEIPDMRAAHPAYSPEQCFQRLNKKVKSMLKRRHVPIGILISLEDELISFFKEWPTCVYISQHYNAFERMLLHAVCQYLDLSSRSFNDGDIRKTEVENNHNFFDPPEILLSQYLEKCS